MTANQCKIKTTYAERPKSKYRSTLTIQHDSSICCAAQTASCGKNISMSRAVSQQGDNLSEPIDCPLYPIARRLRPRRPRNVMRLVKNGGQFPWTLYTFICAIVHGISTYRALDSRPQERCTSFKGNWRRRLHTGVRTRALPHRIDVGLYISCLLYTSPSPRDRQKSRMPSSA